MFGKLAEAVRLLGANLWLFSRIALTVWLPGNVLINYVAYYVPLTEEQALMGPARMTMWIEGIFGPIYIGATIYALSKLKQGQAVSYSEAIGVGFRNWGALFAARFVAGLIIMLGLIAFILPGIHLSLRYALLNSTVILEGASVSKARQRSAKLTEGRILPIFGTAMLFYVGIMLLSVLVYVPLEFMQQLNTMAVAVVIDCFLDIGFLVITIAMFLYYWEARQEELGIEESPVAPALDWQAIGDVQAQLEEAPDDDNPFRSPKF